MGIKSADYIGSFFIVGMDSYPLIWKIQSIAEVYAVPTYSENPVSATSLHYRYDAELGWVEDPSGEYIQDPANPARYILRVYEANPAGTYVAHPLLVGKYIPKAEHPTEGYYGNYKDVLAAAGVIFQDA